MIGAVVLAAGAATRFGAPKQRLMLAEVLDRLGHAPVDDIVVVEGAHPLERARARGTRIVPCHDWERGPGASLRCGLAALGPGTEAAVVVLADGPDLAPAAIVRVLESWRAEDGDVVAASYGGVRGHPVVLARGAWGAIPDEGLRMRDARLVACDDLGSPGDVDVPADLPVRLRGAVPDARPRGPATPRDAP